MKAIVRCQHCGARNTFSASYKHRDAPIRVHGQCHACGGSYEAIVCVDTHLRAQRLSYENGRLCVLLPKRRVHVVPVVRKVATDLDKRWMRTVEKIRRGLPC